MTTGVLVVLANSLPKSSFPALPVVSHGLFAHRRDGGPVVGPVQRDGVEALVAPQPQVGVDGEDGVVLLDEGVHDVDDALAVLRSRALNVLLEANLY